MSIRLALLGCDQEARQLVAAALRRGHRLEFIYGVDDDSELRDLAPLAEWQGDWEVQLHQPQVEAVIVARQATAIDREDALRKLVAADIPLLVVHPPCLPIVAIELEMIRSDVGGWILPAYPGRDDPLLKSLVEDVQNGALGELESVLIERHLPEADPEETLRCFARDTDLMRELAGEFSRVNAAGTDLEQQKPVQLTVTAQAIRGAICRWSTTPLAGDGQLLVTGSEARRLYRIASTPPAEAEQATEFDSSQEEVPVLQVDPVESAERAVERLERALAEREAGDKVPSRDGEVDSQTEWSDACRSLEVVEAVQRSWKRGRAVDLYQEEHTEEGSFKGIMAVGGCGLLLFALLTLIGFTALQGLTMPSRDTQRVQEISRGEERPEPLPRTHLAIRLLPLYPFAIFLLLQLLRFVFPRRRQESHPPSGRVSRAAEGMERNKT